MSGEWKGRIYTRVGEKIDPNQRTAVHLAGAHIEQRCERSGNELLLQEEMLDNTIKSSEEVNREIESSRCRT